MWFIITSLISIWIGIEINIWWASKFEIPEEEEGCICYRTPAKCDYCWDLEESFENPLREYEHLFENCEELSYQGKIDYLFKQYGIDITKKSKIIDVTDFSQNNSA